MNTLPPLQEMERAYLGRDSAFDGLFVLGVRTTGIFCRPTCPARKPLPRNVEYFATAREALASGYRPCKRCRPLHVDDQPDWATRLIDQVEQNPTQRIREGDLHRQGVDPATVRRYFQKRFGMTFHAYTRARRLGQALGQIREGGKLDNVVFDSGFDSHSGFRDAFVRTFGKAPGQAREQDCVSLHWIRSPLGPLVAGSTTEGVCLLEFTDRRMIETQFKTLERLFKLPLVPRKTEHLALLESEVDAYFAGTLRDFTVTLTYPGSDFQRRVWDELLKIPYGETRSYEALAESIGSPGAQRAVGHANGLNRIGIVIPCHRVVNKSGKLGGYGGGLRRKEFLLNLERGGQGQLFS